MSDLRSFDITDTNGNFHYRRFYNPNGEYVDADAVKELQAKVERYRKCLQRIVDEGWDRYGCAEALKQKGE